MQDKDFYPKEKYYTDKRNNTKLLILNIGILIIGLSLFFLSGFLITKDNVPLFVLLDSVILIVTFIAFFYVNFFCFIPRKRRLHFVFRLLTVNRYKGEFKVESIQNHFQINKDIFVNCVEGINDEGKKVIYYIEDNINQDFILGKTYTIYVAKNYIVGVIDYEN